MKRMKKRGSSRCLALLLLIAMSFCLAGCMEEEGVWSEDDEFWSEEGDFWSEGDESRSEEGELWSEEEGVWSEDAESQSEEGEVWLDKSEADYAGTGIPLYGSSGKLDGTIAVVTILADDATGTWELSEDDDFQLYSQIYANLQIGCQWISEECARYGRNVSFVWDWVQHGDLIYQTALNMDISQNYVDAWRDVSEFIRTGIDSEGIKASVGANGIIYMVCVDSPADNTEPSVTIRWERDVPVEYETCLMMMRRNGYATAPAAFAHEMLHTFGAVDLYYAGKKEITQEYVDAVKASGLNDIMRVTWNPDTGRYVYDCVLNEITDITAYYTGLTDYSETVSEWGFEESDYEGDLAEGAAW